MGIIGADRPRLRLAVGGLLFAAGLAFALARLGSVGEVGALRVGAPWFMVDFRHVVYYPSRAFWDGINPYNGGLYMERYPVEIPVNLYPPATFLLFAPFGLLPLGVSSAAYFVFTLVLTVVLAWVALQLAGWRPAASAVLGVSGLLLLSRPGHWNLLSGQVTLIVVLATYLALVFARRAPQLAGVGLALAFLKPTFGVPLLPALLARGAGRAVGWGLGLTAALNVPILLILVWRAGGLDPFVTSVAQTVRAFQANPDAHPVHAIWRVDLPATISRLFSYPLGLSEALLVCAVLWIPVVIMSRPLIQSGNPARKFTIDALVCCTVLLSLFHQAYDLLLLTLPAVALARTLLEKRRPESLHLAQALLLLLLSLNYVTTHAALAALRLTPGQRLIVVSLNGVALIGLFALYLIEARQLQRALS